MEELLTERIGDVFRLTLNRPQELNSISAALALEIPRVMADCVAQGARAILVTGAGRGFCSGASLSGAKSGLSHDAQMESLYNPLARAFYNSPVPLVTAVNGVAAGAGAALAFAGDIIVAARSASFVLSFAKIALVPDCGATWLVARAAGRARAMQMAMLGDKMPAAEALAAGLITQIAEDDALQESAMQVATRLASMPTRTLEMIRKQVNSAFSQSFEESLQTERVNQCAAALTPDFAEGVAAFRERRPPIFTGK